MIKYIVVMLLCFSSLTVLAQEKKEATMERTWFSGHEFEFMEIKQFDHATKGDVPIRTLRIDDKQAVKTLASRIDTIPAQGPEFRSFVPKERIELSFGNAEAKDVVNIYDKHFKTPSTGFNASKEALKIEEAVYDDVMSLLRPRLGQNLLKIVGFAYDFQDFSVVYEGRTFFKEPLVSVSGQRDMFVVKGGAEEQKLVITSGQLPPQPHPFTAGNKDLVLQTYRTNKGDEVRADHFQIEVAKKKK